MRLIFVTTLVFFLLVEIYFFQSLRVIAADWSVLTRRAVYILYWSVTGIVLVFVSLYYIAPESFSNQARQWIFTSLFMLFIPKLLGAVFLLIDDGRRLVAWIASKLYSGEGHVDAQPEAISRSEFLSKASLVTAAVPFAVINFGIISGAHDYRIRRKTLYLKTLPKAFDGIRLAQISDIHTGSFFNKTAVKGGVEMIMNEKPDLIFFTGDLVNEETKEVKNYIDVFDKLDAPLGVFSSTGNHDYGDYKDWKSPEAKAKNFEDLIQAHKELGWQLLRNENKVITVDGEKIVIAGVENWGAGRFSKYGDFSKAMDGTTSENAVILMSHDPSSWDAMIRKEYPQVDLTLSGHTHGFQFGIEIGGFRWSPSQYIYKQWAGHYQENDQHIYVNRGFGYIGFPGRVGMPPEITILELKRG